jgi:heterodisulfide reductase subunit A-like polyferredoxin
MSPEATMGGRRMRARITESLRRVAHDVTVERRRVVVIGAGTAGLVTTKVLRDDGFDVSAFENEPAAWHLDQVANVSRFAHCHCAGRDVAGRHAGKRA